MKLTLIIPTSWSSDRDYFKLLPPVMRNTEDEVGVARNVLDVWMLWRCSHGDQLRDGAEDDKTQDLQRLQQHFCSRMSVVNSQVQFNCCYTQTCQATAKVRWQLTGQTLHFMTLGLGFV